ncbi:pyrroline-5-carboxylate reductase [Sphingomonas sp.]|uniref:pyrroline-5-carboxylate reductase n=1 Tax=Sphingomonas sp. TaxID=28214 RepID=UPI001DEEBC2F|nr:pyrroline-5-carboxylate reductase [Sphingomonas sp.]MBX9796856.1 pyrroline-5-carboxylate reductase [Sphingomonas sp.]
MRLWLIGCGAMGGAMLRRWIAAGTLSPGDVFVVNRSDRALPAGVAQGRVPLDGPLPDAVLLAMKPQQLDAVAQAHAARLAGVPLIVSILAGVEEAAIARRFTASAVVRAMPNLPVALGAGVVALDSAGADAVARASVSALMAPLGLVEWVPVAHFDLVTALAGSGPAFLYRFIDALAAAGAAEGLPPDQAARLALATVAGAARLAEEPGLTPAERADQVASPGGSTRKGLDVLDQPEGLVALLRATLAASARRNAELAAAAR